MPVEDHHGRTQQLVKANLALLVHQKFSVTVAHVVQNGKLKYKPLRNALRVVGALYFIQEKKALMIELYRSAVGGSSRGRQSGIVAFLAHCLGLMKKSHVENSTSRCSNLHLALQGRGCKSLNQSERIAPDACGGGGRTCLSPI
mmetsp:Transcript_39379/g.113214  ORF Transcript_39379/g.113214 Transcript_39379/m.113214 type:complete len:144 (+) Transcript_39379:356-787(+)